MTAILSAAEMRAAEEWAIAAGTDVETLMVRAGAGVAEAAWHFAGGIDTLVICGPGNNGGDGYVVAAMLQRRGVKVRVAAQGAPKTKAARGACAAWGGPIENLADAEPAPLLIDALFGTGLTRRLAQPIAADIIRLAAGASLTIAVDLPSGVATDDGAVLSPVPDFDMTVALGNPKPSHLLQPAARHMGRLVVADIGLGPIEARTTLLERPRLRVPAPDAHKYSRGTVGVIGGAMWGAAILTASATQRAGAGSVVVAGVDHAGPASLIRKSEVAVLADERLGAVVIGPGLGRDKAADLRLGNALATKHRLVLDADALTLIGASIARLKRLPVQPILTPHAGEFHRLFGDLRGSKIERTRFAADKASSVVVFKGPDTVIAAPDGRVAVARPGPSWLASAGTGDVLSGIVAAMLVQGLDPFEAAQAAVWLHAEAARRAGPVLIADDLIPALPGAVAACL
jgi:hydroxyethylthiazole kinase-like uncharacterized protein yjeF